jgi:hypothetical protein
MGCGLGGKDETGELCECVANDECGGEPLEVVRCGDELKPVSVGLAAMKPRDIRRPKLIGFCGDEDKPTSNPLTNRQKNDASVVCGGGVE